MYGKRTKITLKRKGKQKQNQDQENSRDVRNYQTENLQYIFKY